MTVIIRSKGFETKIIQLPGYSSQLAEELNRFYLRLDAVRLCLPLPCVSLPLCLCLRWCIDVLTCVPVSPPSVLN